MKIFVALAGIGTIGFGAALIFGGTALLIATVAQLAVIAAVAFHRSR